MKRGYLSDYFIGAGVKSLSATEVDPETSHGHELQGVDAFRKFLGAPSEKQTIPVTYIWLDEEDAPLRLDLSATWYDSRKAQPHRTSEYRLYYPAAANEIAHKAQAGDRLFLCLSRSNRLLAVFCRAHGSYEQQLLWLFDLQVPTGVDLNERDLRDDRKSELNLTAKFILELLEIEVDFADEEWLERLLKKFGGAFPSSAQFSNFARENVKDVSSVDHPDDALLRWAEFEERLFFTLERHLVADRLRTGFVTGDIVDFEGFVQFSLSVQNRRKARAGSGLENHLEAIFQENKLQFARGAVTEERNRPDFLFPGAKEYRDPKFAVARLTMLGAKSTLKERWRQVLREADRIEHKHLLTLEPGISEFQTDQMRARHLQLVVPAGIQGTYRPAQREWLVTLAQFISLVRERQQEND